MTSQSYQFAYINKYFDSDTKDTKGNQIKQQLPFEWLEINIRFKEEQSTRIQQFIDKTKKNRKIEIIPHRSAGVV